MISETSTRLGDLLVWDTDHRYCRETWVAEGAVALGQVLKNGTSATTQKAPAAAGDTTVCNAIALNAAADGKPVVVLVRGPAIVISSALVHASGATTNQKAAQRAALLTAGIVSRPVVS